MTFKYNVSLLALLAALAAPPAMAQLDVQLGDEDGVDVEVDISDGVEADANVGGEDGLDAEADIGTSDGEANVDADVDLGSGDEGSTLDTDVDIRAGGEDDDSLVDLNADADALGGDDDGALVDADADVSIGSGGNLISLNDAEQGDALVGLIGDSGIDDVDLDAAIDDTEVAIVDVNEDMDADSLADIEVALLNGDTSGMEETQAAVEASATLSSILNDEGLSADDVLALELGPDGEAYVYVLPGGVESLQASAGVGLGQSEVANAQASLLSDDELASASLVVLPDDAEVSGNGGADADGSAGADVEADADVGGSGSADDTESSEVSDTSGSITDDAEGAAPSDTAGEAGAAVTAGVSADGTTPCPADLRAFLQSTATAAEIRAASEAQVVELTGCSDTGLIAAADFSRLQEVIEADPAASAAVEAEQDISIDDIVSATVTGDTVVLYAIAE